ncbi:MAG: hypothetical protein GKR89_34420 [Candidatus Latescibacteria bacterium]|nr:hypothetical protein [Candidatus Latescibacterota bacterium]
MTGLISRSLLVLLALAGAVWGGRYGLNFQHSGERMSWRHQLPSWSYSVPVRLAADSTSMLRLSASASLSSILDRRTSGVQWQDQARLSARATYPILGPRASIGLATSFSHRRATLRRQNLANRTFTFNMQYRPLLAGPFQSLRISVAPGLVTASRLGVDEVIEEQGVEYSASLAVSPDWSVGGEKVSHTLSLSKRDNTLQANRDRSETLSMGLGYGWPRQVRTSFNFSESRNQQSLSQRLVAGQDGLRRTRSRRLGTSLSWRAGGWDWAHNFNLRWADLAYSVNAVATPENRLFGKDRRDWDWSSAMGLSGRLGAALTTSLKWDYGRRDEYFPAVKEGAGANLLERRPGRLGRDLALRWQFDWQPAEGRTLALGGQAVSKREDNPTQAGQERDFSSLNLHLSYRGRLGRELAATLQLSGRFAHKVNLHAVAAGDNFRSRDLELKVRSNYRRLGVDISHNFAVAAKRTLYDFDRVLSLSEGERRSGIRRVWSTQHTLQRRLGQHLRLNAAYNLRADDDGKLIAEEGVQSLWGLVL